MHMDSEWLEGFGLGNVWIAILRVYMKTTKTAAADIAQTLVVMK